VSDRSTRPFDGSHPVRGGGGDARQVADQIEHGALRREQVAGARLDRQQRVPWGQAGAVLDALLDSVLVGAEHGVEHQQCDVHTCGHPRFPGHQLGDRPGVGGHRRE